MHRFPIIPVIFLIIIVLVNSCYSGQLTISVLEPASVTIPSDIKKVTILPIPGVPDPIGEFDSLKFIDIDPNINSREIKLGYLHGVYDLMRSSPRFQKVVINDSLDNGDSFGGYINWGDIDQACARDTTDVVLLLAKAITHDSGVRLYIEAGSNEYVHKFTLINHTKWAFYLPEKHLEVMTFIDVDTIFAELNSHDSNIENMLYQACYTSGYAVGQSLCPSWNDDVLRIYFKGPGRDMKNASSLVSEDNWHDAAIIWDRLSESSDYSIASRAAHNLALTYERDDILDQASLWISYADSLKSNYITTTYKKILTDRLSKKAELDKQLLAR